MIEELELEFEDLVLEFEDEPAPRNNFTYRRYQIEAFEGIEAGWLEFSRQLIVLATGCGKTLIFTKVAKDFVERGQKVLILAHTEELLDQAADKLERSTGLTSAREKAQEYASTDDMIVVASVQTLCRENRLSMWEPDHFGLIIVDECHRSLAVSYQRILKYFTAKVLGVTATADRGDRRSLGKFYENVAYQYGILEACRDGYLVRPIVKQVPVKIDLSGIRSRGGDYDAKTAGERLNPCIDSIARAIFHESEDRKTLMFLPTVATAIDLAAALSGLGLQADFVSGACQDRSQKIERFRSGKIRYLCNAMLLTEGFDDDSVSCVVVLRPTKIRSLFVQCIGRGTRTITGLIDGVEDKQERLDRIANSAKPNLLILDFLWLSDKLDLISPVNLVSDNKDVLDRMKKKAASSNGPMDLLDTEEAVERDLLASLEAAVEKNSRKRKRLIDPLSLAVVTGDADLAEYEPEQKWERQPPTEGQLKLLQKHGINTALVKYKGLASKLIGKIMKRHEAGLCTLKQANFLSTLGFTDAANLTRQQASNLIDANIGSRKR